ncbi:MAG: FtsX-like permease family protein [Planctomycetota bacterium]|nr:FtsX-like permease family protein [Planctomycetota bacterium]
MYQTILTTRYLTSRVIPLIAVAAVALCVALVIVVVSVMSGFLDMVQSAGRTLMGDVIISYGISGIPHYEELSDRLEKDPNIQGASPIIDGWGLLRMPYPDSDAKQSETVQVWGIEPTSFARVTQFDKTLQWKTVSSNQLNWLLLDTFNEHSESLLELIDLQKQEACMNLVNDASNILTYQSFDLWNELQAIVGKEVWKTILSLDERLANPDAVLQQGLALSKNGKDAIVSGLHVSDGNSRQKDGTYNVIRNDYWWLPRFNGTLTMLPIDSRGGIIDPESVIMPFVNEFQSGVFIIDESRIFVPISVTQQLLHLDPAEIVDPDDPTIILGVDPARSTSVLVRGVEGISAEELRRIVNDIYDDFLSSLPSDTLVRPPSRSDPGLTINTWKEQQRSFTGPVEKERELMRTLFSIVYFVVAALILSIFWSIVHEKTRDIGILRSVGASRSGIVWIFLQYSLVIGVFGALLGLLIGWLITSNINTIHASMGNPPVMVAVLSFMIGGCIAVYTITKYRTGLLLPMVLGSIGVVAFCIIGGLVLYIKHVGGLVIWDASVYYFSVIPNHVDWPSSIFTMVGAIVFCLLGAVIPAARAADTDPVEALRHE